MSLFETRHDVEEALITDDNLRDKVGEIINIIDKIYAMDQKIAKDYDQYKLHAPKLLKAIEKQAHDLNNNASKALFSSKAVAEKMIQYKQLVCFPIYFDKNRKNKMEEPRNKMEELTLTLCGRFNWTSRCGRFSSC